MDETKWLVKTNGQVIGPLSEEQIKYKISEKTLVPIDELALPFGRWRFLRDVACFARVLEEMRISDSSGSEHTYTYTQTVDSDTFLQTKSKEVVLEALEEEHSSQFVEANKRQTQGFTYDDDPNLIERANNLSKKYWTLFLVIAVLILGAVSFQQFVKKPKDMRSKYSVLIEQGKYLYGNGAYGEALKRLQIVEQSDTRLEAIKHLLGPLLLKVEQDTNKSIKYIQESQKFTPKELNNFKGIVAVYENKISEATHFFGQSLALDERFIPAHFNKGVAYFLIGQYDKAVASFSKVLSYGGQDSFSYLHYIISLLKLYNYNLPDEVYFRVNTFIEKLKSEQVIYPQETLFYSLLVDVFRHGSENIDISTRITKILDQDPEHSLYQSQNINIGVNLIHWNYIFKDCEALTLKLGTAAPVKLLHSYCLLKSGKYKEAEKQILKLASQSPKDGLIQSILAYLYLQQNQLVEATVAVGRAIEYSGQVLTLPYILQGQICREESDYACARENYFKVLQKNENAVIALWGLGEVSLAEKQYDKAEEHIKNSLEVTPSYSRSVLSLMKIKESRSEN